MYVSLMSCGRHEQVIIQHRWFAEIFNANKLALLVANRRITVRCSMRINSNMTLAVMNMIKFRITLAERQTNELKRTDGVEQRHRVDR